MGMVPAWRPFGPPELGHNSRILSRDRKKIEVIEMFPGNKRKIEWGMGNWESGMSDGGWGKGDGEWGIREGEKEWGITNGE